MKMIVFITIIEVIITSIYLYFIKTYYGKVMNIIYFLQLVAFAMLLVKNFKSKITSMDRAILQTFVISIILTTLIFNQNVIAYYLTGDTYNRDHAPWKYYNLYAGGNELNIESFQNYNLSSNEFIADEIIEELELFKKPITLSNTGLRSSEKVVFDSDGQVGEYYRDSEFLYSIYRREYTENNKNEREFLINRYSLDKALIDSVSLDSICTYDNSNSDPVIEYYDSINNQFYLSCYAETNTLKITRFNKDLKLEEFTSIDIASEYNIFDNHFNLTRFDKVQDKFRVTILDRTNKNKNYFFDIDEEGTIISSYVYKAEESFYKLQTFNVDYSNDKIYLINYVRTKEGPEFLYSDFKTYRIDELNNNFELQKSTYLRSDNLKEYEIYFKVVEDEGKYLLYSNTDIIEYTTIGKDVMKALNVLLLSYVGIFYVILFLNMGAYEALQRQNELKLNNNDNEIT